MSSAPEKVSGEIFPIQKGWDGFFNASIKSLSKIIVHSSDIDIERNGEKLALGLFRKMAERVPAYKDFLKKHKVRPDKIKTIVDFKYLPTIDKENYIKKYRLSSLCWDGKLRAPIISASSGSTGEAFYWPRSSNIEIETSYIYEAFLVNLFRIDKYSTLLINGFSMGIYIGGTFTLNCSMRITKKGYPLTIMTPGIDKKEILRIINTVSNDFEQIIIAGYPPLVRDILDEGEAMGINWKKKKLRFLFASEALSEDFRAYIFKKAGIKPADYFTTSLNLYGTADAALLGHEMPLGNFLRKVFSENPIKCKEFFGASYVPSINQYYPFLKYFESVDKEIVLSSRNTAIPLCRYNIHDRGDVLSFKNVFKILNSLGYTRRDVEKEIPQSLLWRLPYVYIYGRSDFTVTLYGLNIYPENIHVALYSKKLRSLSTGRFVMEVVNHKKDQNQYLLLHIELKARIKPTKKIEHLFQHEIIKILCKKNSEYNHLFRAIREKALPEIDLRKKGDIRYFPDATKQKWVEKKHG